MSRRLAILVPNAIVADPALLSAIMNEVFI